MLLKYIFYYLNMRYSRQERLPDIGTEGQKILSENHVVIVGVGALGSVAAELLARAGVGKLTLIDRDCVELHNLQRQTLFTEEDVGQPKATIAEKHIKYINSEIAVHSVVTDVDYENVDILHSDLILDGTDNLQTRFLINEYSRKHKIPWIYAAAVGAEGYVKSYLPNDKDCFACTFTATTGLDSCETLGVLNTITHSIASMQVTEALKILLGKEPEQKMVHYNAWNQKLEKITTAPRDDCLVCQGTYEYLIGKHTPSVVQFCGSGTYQIKGKPVNLQSIAKKLKDLGEVVVTPACITFKTLTLFADGRALIKAANEAEAQKLYAQYIGH